MIIVTEVLTLSKAVRHSGERLNKVLPRIDAPADWGLSEAQARERFENGYANVAMDPATKTVGQIIIGNICTYFNLIFCQIAEKRGRPAEITSGRTPRIFIYGFRRRWIPGRRRCCSSFCRTPPL